jgi:hypothetical protein
MTSPEITTKIYGDTLVVRGKATNKHGVAFNVVLEIDLPSLVADIGGNAIRNKSGRAVGLSGIIKARTSPP